MKRRKPETAKAGAVDQRGGELSKVAKEGLSRKRKSDGPSPGVPAMGAITPPMVLADIRQLIENARQRVAIAVNAELTLLYWHIGKRLQEEVLAGERAEYGKQVVRTVSQQLTAEYGKGWGERQLWLCLQMASAFPTSEIVNTLCAELSWSHLRLLLGVDTPLKRTFYIEICRLERWSVRQLQDRIQSQLFERTAISKKPEETIQQDLQDARKVATTLRQTINDAGLNYLLCRFAFGDVTHDEAMQSTKLFASQIIPQLA